jgi:signal transduction histidine kinase
MNHRILIQVTTPAVAIGLLLFGACLASAWYVSRLQSNLASVLTAHVSSQKAAQELEIRVRQLRYHSFLYLLDPTPDRRKRITEDHDAFAAAVRLAQESARTQEQLDCIARIEKGYQQYDSALDDEIARTAAGGTRADLVRIATAHPLTNIVEPSQELLALNKDMMDSISDESQRVARQAKWTLILIGFLGPAGGVIAGFGIARGLSRSIYQLSVRVRDMAQSLDQDVASVSVEADGDLQTLDRQLQHVVRRVEEVTERQQRHQREMLRAEQLAAVGTLAAGVAHELRNPLTAVKMLVEGALRSENRKPLDFGDLQVIHREIARLEQTIQGLLDFARLPAPQRGPCDLRAIVGEAADLVRVRSRAQKVELAVRCPDSAVDAEVDAAQVRTVLVNLFLNALDAMPSGGRLEVSLETAPGEEVRLCVADTGGGISPEMLERLFTPFTTTKATGTGLGLSISRRIVEEHGGRLVVANRREGGACFTITLPPAEALAAVSG